MRCRCRCGHDHEAVKRPGKPEFRLCGFLTTPHGKQCVRTLGHGGNCDERRYFSGTTLENERRIAVTHAHAQEPPGPAQVIDDLAEVTDQLEELRRFVGTSDATRFEMLQMALEENRAARALLKRVNAGYIDDGSDQSDPSLDADVAKFLE